MPQWVTLTFGFSTPSSREPPQAFVLTETSSKKKKKKERLRKAAGFPSGQIKGNLLDNRRKFHLIFFFNSSSSNKRWADEPRWLPASCSSSACRHWILAAPGHLCILPQTLQQQPAWAHALRGSGLQNPSLAFGGWALFRRNRMAPKLP